MSTRFQEPIMQALDDTGTAVGGSRLFFYAQGTTTFLDTYQDQDLTLLAPLQRLHGLAEDGALGLLAVGCFHRVAGRGRRRQQVAGLYHAGSVGIIMSGWLGALNYGVIVSNGVDSFLMKNNSQTSATPE